MVKTTRRVLKAILDNGNQATTKEISEKLGIGVTRVHSNCNVLMNWRLINAKKGRRPNGTYLQTIWIIREKADKVIRRMIQEEFGDVQV
jgi:transcription initiation factor IIE alpha subunit